MKNRTFFTTPVRAFDSYHNCTVSTLSPSTVNKIIRTLSAIMRHAVENNKIRENPVRRVKELTAPEPLEEFLTFEQKEQMFRELEKYPQLRNITLVAVLTGWREGQILSLKASDLDYQNKRVRLVASKGKPAKFRPVGRSAWELLTKLALETNCDWLFYNPKTETRLGDLPKRHWNHVRKAIGLPKFRFHSLRAGIPTTLAELGFSPFDSRDTLDHSRVDTTQIYVRNKDARIIEALEAIENQNREFIH